MSRGLHLTEEQIFLFARFFHYYDGAYGPPYTHTQLCCFFEKNLKYSNSHENPYVVRKSVRKTKTE